MIDDLRVSVPTESERVHKAQLKLGRNLVGPAVRAVWQFAGLVDIRVREVEGVYLLDSDAHVLTHHRLDELVQEDRSLAAPVSHFSDAKHEFRTAPPAQAVFDVVLVIVPAGVVALLVMRDDVDLDFSHAALPCGGALACASWAC
jgi:hypothetical protein